MARFMMMDKVDTVATALNGLKKGENAKVYSNENDFLFEVSALDEIPFGNKIALTDIKEGDKVIKYGAAIGECTKDIKKGELVHVHNVKSLVVDIPSSFKKEIMRQMNIN